MKTFLRRPSAGLSFFGLVMAVTAVIAGGTVEAWAADADRFWGSPGGQATGAAPPASAGGTTAAGLPRVISAERYGPFVMGTPDEVLFQRKLLALPPGLREVDDEDSCYYPDLPGEQAARGRQDLSPLFIVYKDRLARITIDDPAVVTTDGLRIGDTVGKLLQVYAKDPVFQKENANIFKEVQQGQRAYSQDTTVFIALPRQESAFGIAYWVWDSAIQEIMVGEKDTLTWTEGCGTTEPVRRRPKRR